MIYTFNRGNWEDGNNLPKWGDEEECDEYLKRIGYSTSKISFGDEYGSQIDIYESMDSKSFYASVCPSGGTCFEVFIPDFPSLMIFIKDYGTAFSTNSSNFRQQEILNLLEKLFQLQHGHSAQESCVQCDPEGYAAKIKARDEYRSSKKTAVT
jgi:hypothetical protein